MGDMNGVLLISGLHANESATAPLAERVRRSLAAAGIREEHYHVPYAFTLHACVVKPESADPRYCFPKPGGAVDTDLQALVGERALHEKFPHFVHFEFHNSRDVWGHFGIDPDKPVEQYEVGTIMPVFTRPYEIGTWRNVLPDGTPGKYVLEAPAVFRPVSDSAREARLARVELLANAGYRLEAKTVELYLLTEVDLVATQRKRLLDRPVVDKITSWITSCFAASRDSNSD